MNDEQNSPVVECVSCGARGQLIGLVHTSACKCQDRYLTPSARAKEDVKNNPEKSDRAIAAESGISKDTIRRARPTGADASVKNEKRLGKDGKRRSMPKLRSNETKLKTPEPSPESKAEVSSHSADWHVGYKAGYKAGYEDGKKSQLH